MWEAISGIIGYRIPAVPTILVLMQKPKILVIDDDDDFRDCILGIVAPHGYDVLLADDGTQGLARAREWKPDLIISDVIMPETNGYQVCRTLRAEGIQVPFLFLTGKQRTGDILQGYETGADDYLAKPVNGRVLLAKIKTLLSRRQGANGAD